MGTRTREAMAALKGEDKKTGYLLLLDVIAENPRNKDAKTA